MRLGIIQPLKFTLILPSNTNMSIFLHTIMITMSTTVIIIIIIMMFMFMIRFCIHLLTIHFFLYLKCMIQRFLIASYNAFFADLYNCLEYCKKLFKSMLCEELAEKTALSWIPYYVHWNFFVNILQCSAILTIK